MRRALQWINHGLIVLFALASGVFKVLGGEADLVVFAHLGMGLLAVQIFGAVQALGGVALVFGRTTRIGTAVVVACNVLATAGLFAAQVTVFGVVSILFVAMAALEWKLDDTGRFARPR